MKVEKAKVPEVAVETVEVVTTPAEVVDTVVDTVVATEPIVETIEVTPVVNNGVSITEKSTTDGADDVTKTEEAVVDASINNTDIVPGQSPAIEDVIAPVEVGEPTMEATPVIAEDIIAKANSYTEQAISTAIAPLLMAIENMQKSIEESNSLTKTQKEVTQSNEQLLVKSLEGMATVVSQLRGQVDSMNNHVAFRKSMAVAVEKKETSTNIDLSTQE